MASAKENKRQDEKYSIENAMNTLFVKLDEAIDDIENGRVITEDEMWAELDKRIINITEKYRKNIFI